MIDDYTGWSACVNFKLKNPIDEVRFVTPLLFVEVKKGDTVEVIERLPTKTLEVYPNLNIDIEPTLTHKIKITRVKHRKRDRVIVANGREI